MPAEIIVTVKNEEKKLVSKFLIYHTFMVCDTDETIIECVEQTIKEFGDNETDDVYIRINMQIG